MLYVLDGCALLELFTEGQALASTHVRGMLADADEGTQD